MSLIPQHEAFLKQACVQSFSAECEAQRSKKSTAHVAHTDADMFNILHAYTATDSIGGINGAA